MTRLAEYLETTQSPMRRAKVAAALNRQMRLDGVYYPRWRVGECLAGLEPRRDEAKGRLYHGDQGHFYDISALTVTLVDYILWLNEG